MITLTKWVLILHVVLADPAGKPTALSSQAVNMASVEVCRWAGAKLAENMQADPEVLHFELACMPVAIPAAASSETEL